MYQIKMSGGHEIQVQENHCTVIDGNGNEQFTGNYDACLKWAKDRGMRATTAGANAAEISASKGLAN